MDKQDKIDVDKEEDGFFVCTISYGTAVIFTRNRKAPIRYIDLTKPENGDNDELRQSNES